MGVSERHLRRYQKTFVLTMAEVPQGRQRCMPARSVIVVAQFLRQLRRCGEGPTQECQIVVRSRWQPGFQPVVVDFRRRAERQVTFAV